METKKTVQQEQDFLETAKTHEIVSYIKEHGLDPSNHLKAMRKSNAYIASALIEKGRLYGDDAQAIAIKLYSLRALKRKHLISIRDSEGTSENIKERIGEVL